MLLQTFRSPLFSQQKQSFWLLSPSNMVQIHHSRQWDDPGIRWKITLIQKKNVFRLYFRKHIFRLEHLPLDQVSPKPSSIKTFQLLIYCELLSPVKLHLDGAKFCLCSRKLLMSSYLLKGKIWRPKQILESIPNTHLSTFLENYIHKMSHYIFLILVFSANFR